MDTLAHHLWIGFAGGLLGFAHCLGMCGGFVMHLSQEKDRKKMVAGQLLWHFGKLFSYTFLGALAGYTGGYFTALFLGHPLLQNLLSYACGLLMLLMGLSLVGLLPVRGQGPGSATEALSGLCHNLATPGSPGAALTLGMATSLLPCPVVLAFLAYSLQSGSVLNGMAIMGALSLGTMLPLLALGGATRLARLHLRSWAPRVGGIILILLGLTTALRGTSVFHRLLGCPPVPALHQAQTDGTKPCCTGEIHGNGSGH
jgi:uncharacterized protein